MNPLKDGPDYDYVILAGVQSPGICEISGAGTPRDWDKKKGKGISGATIVYAGDDLSEFEVAFRLWTDAHFNAWDLEFGKLVSKPPVGEKATAMDIEHPWLADVGIKSVVVKDASQWQKDGDTGVFVKKVKFIQYRAPKPASGKPKGSASTSTNAGGGKGSEKDDIDRQIDNLNGQVNNLAKG